MTKTCLAKFGLFDPKSITGQNHLNYPLEVVQRIVLGLRPGIFFTMAQ
jgi:hypothetical protein